VQAVSALQTRSGLSVIKPFPPVNRRAKIGASYMSAAQGMLHMHEPLVLEFPPIHVRRESTSDT